MLAIYAGFDADHAYYAYAYLREDFYKSSGARAAHAGNLTVTLGKNVKGKGKLDAEKYVSRGRCDDFDYDLCAVAFTSELPVSMMSQLQPRSGNSMRTS